uniref:Uncharacterized protein n=1 Tax=Pristionchus pacificus TaxID=54126 RepID=A0A2A6BCN0_PRIPA|eukprot:PDM63628.1 hypothetical protein PRIPAC_49601 [Pristionchus pacificus]
MSHTATRPTGMDRAMKTTLRRTAAKSYPGLLRQWQQSSFKIEEEANEPGVGSKLMRRICSENAIITKMRMD